MLRIVLDRLWQLSSRCIPAGLLAGMLTCVTASAQSLQLSVHLQVLRDAYRSFSAPLPRGSLNATIHLPHRGLAYEVRFTWDGPHEYLEVADYNPVADDGAGSRNESFRRNPRMTRSLVGPDGSMFVHLPGKSGEQQVVNLNRAATGRDLSRDFVVRPEPHRTWYQMSWRGESQWLTFLEKIVSGQHEVRVRSAETLPNGDVTVSCTNVANGLDWELTYAPRMECRIISYGLSENTQRSTWDWAQDGQGAWYLREYRYFPPKRGRNETMQPCVLRIHQFSREPEIPANRFRFQSMPLSSGTFVYEQQPGNEAPLKRIIGRPPAAGAASTLTELQGLAELLRSRGFGEANREHR